jgi:hypothetical protein
VAAAWFHAPTTGFPPLETRPTPDFIQPSLPAFYNSHLPVRDVTGAGRLGWNCLHYPHHPQGNARSRQRFIPKQGFKRLLEDFSMISRPNEAAIDEIVASCNGDIRGALRALLMVNEHLEAELQQLYAAVNHGGAVERGSNILH